MQRWQFSIYEKKIQKNSFSDFSFILIISPLFFKRKKYATVAEKLQIEILKQFQREYLIQLILGQGTIVNRLLPFLYWV